LRPLFLIFALLLSGKILSENIQIRYVDSSGNVIRTDEINFQITGEIKKPNPVLNFLQKKIVRTRRLTAAVLAFPFPFGIVGLHRIYLGTKPWVPVAYIASLGGVFGILPLIDFFAILFDKDFERFENNEKVFMWIRD
jgi:TM2 domain-containing membrane protein YozV